MNQPKSISVVRAAATIGTSIDNQWCLVKWEGTCVSWRVATSRRLPGGTRLWLEIGYTEYEHLEHWMLTTVPVWFFDRMLDAANSIPDRLTEGMQ